jgi:hypothetical protein
MHKRHKREGCRTEQEQTKQHNLRKIHTRRSHSPSTNTIMGNYLFIKLQLFLLSCGLTFLPSASFTVVSKTRAAFPPLNHLRPFYLPKESTTTLRYGELRNVDAQLLFDTWEWTANLGAPAALVAGAVLATMASERESMSPKKSDKRIVRIAKKMARFLLISSFGLEVISIFVTTVTGTMLLSHGDTSGALKSLAFNSPLGFLMHNWGELIYSLLLELNPVVSHKFKPALTTSIHCRVRVSYVAHSLPSGPLSLAGECCARIIDSQRR